MALRVKLKTTGQTGTLQNDQEFDPSVYDLIEGSTAPQITTSTPTQQVPTSGAGLNISPEMAMLSQIMPIKESIKSGIKGAYDIQQDLAKQKEEATKVSEKEKKAQANAKGLVKQVEDLKKDIKDINVLNVLPKKLGGAIGIETQTKRFDRKKALVIQQIAGLMEGGKLTDPDRIFYQEQIGNIGAIGSGQDKALDDVLNAALIKSGYDPETMKAEAGIKGPEETKKKTNNAIPGIQDNPVIKFLLGNATNIAQDVGTGIQAQQQQPQIQQLETMASQFENEAMNTQDQEQRKVLLGNANQIRSQISGVAGETAKGFSTQVTENPLWRSLLGAAEITGAAELPGVVQAGTKLVTKIPQAIKSIKPVQAVSELGKILKIGKNKSITEITEKAADYLADDIVKIETNPSIWGYQKEQAIKNTLKKLDVTGTAEQQYAKLAPKMEALGSKIDDVISNSTKEIPVNTVINDFKTNLSATLRRGELERTSVDNLVKEYIQDVYSEATKGTDKVIGDNLPIRDLYNLKKTINEDYQAVARKLIDKVPLTEKEKVISVARRTLDDLVSQSEPTLKEFSKMQSHLYDAVESIYKARGLPIKEQAIQYGKSRISNILRAASEKP